VGLSIKKVISAVFKRRRLAAETYPDNDFQPSRHPEREGNNNPMTVK
jgi:hypothetical protein